MRSLCIAVVVLLGACTARALFLGDEVSSGTHGHDGGSNGHDGGPNVHDGGPNVHDGGSNVHDGGSNVHDGGQNNHDGGLNDLSVGGPIGFGDGGPLGFRDGGFFFPPDLAQPRPLPSTRGAKVGPGLWLLASDLDKDGYADLVVIEQNGTVRIYLGEPSGGLYTGQSFQVNTHTTLSMAVLADVDGDGRSDLVIAEPGRSDVDIQRGNIGGDTFGDWVRLQAAGTVQSVAVGDLNHDGTQDVVALTADAQVHVFVGAKGQPPTPTTKSFATTAGAQQITLADADHDGNLDAITIDQGGTISILHGDGKLGFGAPTTMMGPPSPSRVLLGDWNGDGVTDLAALGVSNGQVAVNGYYGFASSFSVSPNLSAMVTGGLASGDMTGDGVADLLMTGDSSPVLGIDVSNQKGPAAVRDVMLDEPASFIVVADFDGNGYLDVAASGPTKTQLYLTPKN